MHDTLLSMKMLWRWHTFDALPCDNGGHPARITGSRISGERSSRVAVSRIHSRAQRVAFPADSRCPALINPGSLFLTRTGVYSSLATILYCDVKSIPSFIRIVNQKERRVIPT